MNALAVGADNTMPITADPLVGEPDDPPIANLNTAVGRFSGVRLLVVTDDGTGYRSSRQLVHIPSGYGPAVLSVPHELQLPFKEMLSHILRRSPSLSVVLYLEANRIVSHPEDDLEIYPPLQNVGSADNFLAMMLNGEILEERVYLVQE